MSFRNKTVYQIYPKSFADSNGDGWGDIPGVISKLDYLKDLGIDCIWFNSMTVSPQKDNGYDVKNYREIDSRYGTMEDFEKLSKECGKRGIDIMLDMVFNHTSTAHEWFQKALQGDGKYKNYYILKKGKGNNLPPNNWQSKFGGSAWKYVEQLDEWYLHLFDESQADLNWQNPDVRQECADIVNYWREKGVHGFRFDVVNLISKKSFADDPNHFDGRQFYTDGPHVHEYLKELAARSFGQDKNSITVGEMSSTTLGNCVEYSGGKTGELSMVFTFHHLKVDYHNGKKWELQAFDFHKLKEILNAWQVTMQEKNAWNALFWNNHDQPRALSRFGNDEKYRVESAKMLATAMQLMRGTPYIYMGEEIGMTNAYFTDIQQYRDVESLNIYSILSNEGKSKEDIFKILQERSRDNARTPMQWDTTEHAGFTKGIPWIQVNVNYKEINVEKEKKDKNGIFSWYQKLIQLRKEMLIIQEGIYIPLLEESDTIFAYKRKYNNETMVVFCNFYETKTPLELREYSDYFILLSNYSRTNIQDRIQMQPYECIVLYKKEM